MHGILETTTIRTPLGIRFWDAATETQVRDGLVVTARLPVPAGRTVRAFRTASGLFAFQGLPGLHAYEYGEEEDPAGISPPEAQVFLIEVRDRRRRFQPVSFTERLPRVEKGIYVGPALVSSPPFPPLEGEPPGFYLFSAPTRPLPPGLAVVRAQLVDAATEGPAAHAVLEVAVPGASKQFGLADTQGGVVVLFPYPPLTTLLSGSPPSPPPGQATLHQQGWDLTLRARYAPGALAYLPGTALPELRSVVRQAPALIHAALPTSPPAPLPAETLTATLTYGAPCVVRTGGSSALRIEAQPSSP